ncbi:GNAT family N-acetyltransferase [Embleya sp. AB8]|uniref:GNAT family N-acetyltransferase n=1 Tax=Embleya sp. AB8 TaxID=3156304 RepID=UPI003C771AF5
MVDITGTRLALRELCPNDIDAVLAIYGDEEATRHLSFETRTREQVEAIVERSIASARVDPRTEYATAVTLDGDLIGFARLALDPHSPRGATIGFALRPDTWGNGHGVETVHLLAALAFRHLDLHRIWGARAPMSSLRSTKLASWDNRRRSTSDRLLRQHHHASCATDGESRPQLPRRTALGSPSPVHP